MTILLLLLSVLFACLSIPPYFTFEVRLLWLASVVITEYGQYLARVAAVGLAWSLMRGQAAGLVAALGFAASLIVFALPTVQMFANFDGWQRQLRRAFGGTVAESRFARPDVTRLLLSGRGQPKIEPKEYVYVERDGEALKLDVYPPRSTAPAPWVLVIHGGGWDSGDRRQMPELNSSLAARGIGVVSVDYRLSPKAKWPDARDDVLAAVAYVKAHAAELNLDPARWVILGRSAGGQLAQIVAVTSRDKTLRGCVSLYAPTDMVKAYEWGAEDDILRSRNLVRQYMGGPPESGAREYREASALDFVSAKTPPTLLLHGGRDPLVWVRHSMRLRDRLDEAKVANVLIEVPWGTHGFDYNLWGPGGQTLTMSLDYFLKRVF